MCQAQRYQANDFHESIMNVLFHLNHTFEGFGSKFHNNFSLKILNFLLIMPLFFYNFQVNRLQQLLPSIRNGPNFYMTDY